MLNPPVEWPSGTALRCCLTFSQHSLIYISRPVQFCYWFISPQYASPLSFRRPLSPVLHSFPSDLQPMLESGNNAKGAQIHLASSKRKTTYHCQKAEWWFYFLCFCVCCAHKQKFLLETQIRGSKYYSISCLWELQTWQLTGGILLQCIDDSCQVPPLASVGSIVMMLPTSDHTDRELCWSP